MRMSQRRFNLCTSLETRNAQKGYVAYGSTKSFDKYVIERAGGYIRPLAPL